MADASDREQTQKCMGADDWEPSVVARLDYNLRNLGLAVYEPSVVGSGNQEPSKMAKRLRYICDVADAWVLKKFPGGTYDDPFESWWWRDEEKSKVCYVYLGRELVAAIHVAHFIETRYVGSLNHISEEFNEFVAEEVKRITAHACGSGS